MRRVRTIALTATILILAASRAQAQSSLDGAKGFLGTVTNSARPVGNVLVIALNLHDFAATQTYTALDGSFLLQNLQSGIYKIIAVKQGFVPVIKTVVSSGPAQKLALKLESESRASRKNASASQEIWELRGSLPSDVLRELDLMVESDPAVANYELPRFRGEMLSLTGVTDQTANPAYAQTSLGVHGRLNDNWQVGITGNLQRIEDSAEGAAFGSLAESSVMMMELRSSPTDAYRIASTRSSWLYNDQSAGDREADVRAHNFEWQRGGARLQVRYFAQENLFAAAGFNASNTIEIGGNTTILQTRRNDLGVALRVTQESVGARHDPTNPEPIRVADLSANGSFAMIPAFVLHYGMASRIGLDGQEVAPRTGAEWKVTRGTSLVASGLYKMLDREPATVAMPSIVFWSDQDRVLPRYAYSFGVVSGADENNRLSAIASVTALDAPVRLVFTDGYDHFWDGLEVESGDVRRDVRVSYRREVGNHFAVDVSTTAGTATSRDQPSSQAAKVYITGDLQSTFTPTRTTIAVSYREIQQPAHGLEADYRTERLNVRMSQSLYLPVDVKLLLGLELARAVNSPYLLDAVSMDGSRKYIGGLALNF